MRRLRWPGSVAAPVAMSTFLLLLSCSESDDKPKKGTGGSTTTTTTSSGGMGGAGGHAPGGSGGDSTGCNSLANDGPEVEVQQVAQTLPAPAGGRIEPGAYHLTAVTLYTGPGGATGPTGAKQRERVEYGADDVQVVVDLYQGDGDQHFTLDYSAEETGEISYQGTCPGPLNFPYDQFTVTAPDTLTLLATEPQQELTYRRVVGD